MSTYYIRLTQLIAGMHPHSPATVIVDAPERSLLRIEWRRPHASEPANGINSVLSARVIVDVSGKPDAFLKAVSERRWPTSIPLPDGVATLFDADGLLKEDPAYPLYALPPYVQSAVGQYFEQLNQEIDDFVNLIIWRTGLRLEAKPIRATYGYAVSVDEGTWVSVAEGPLRLETSGLTSAVVADGEIGTFVSQRVADRAAEPIAHELLRESLFQRGTAPRSALTMAIAAAEIGYKQAAASLAPEAEWLLRELPSPSLEKMLKGHLPTLQVKVPLNGPPACPQHLIEELKVGVTLRNDLVHKGLRTVSGERLDRILSAVEDLLWLLDYYAGDSWAASHLTERTATSLGLQPATRPTPGIHLYMAKKPDSSSTDESELHRETSLS